MTVLKSIFILTLRMNCEQNATIMAGNTLLSGAVLNCRKSREKLDATQSTAAVSRMIL